MALEKIANNFGQAGSHLSGQQAGSLKAILTEMQGLSVAVAEGAAPTANVWTVGIGAHVAAENDVYTVTVGEDDYAHTTGAAEDKDAVGDALAALVDAVETLSATYAESVLTITGPTDGTSITVTAAAVDGAAAEIDDALTPVEETVEGDTSAAVVVAGMTAEDTLLAILGIDPDNGTPADIVKDFVDDFECAAGKIEGTTSTSGYNLIVLWVDKQ